MSCRKRAGYRRLYAFLPFSGFVHYFVFTMSLAKRFGSFQPFTRLTSSEDGRQSGVQFGVVTYNTVDDKVVDFVKINLFPSKRIEK